MIQINASACYEVNIEKIYKEYRRCHLSPFFPLRALGCHCGAYGGVDARQPADRGRADTPASAAIQLAQAALQSKAGAGATELKGETVEQRIKDLHAALKITADQEAKWNAVAQDMRENAAAMDKLIAENRKSPPQNMTAVDDRKCIRNSPRRMSTG